MVIGGRSNLFVHTDGDIMVVEFTNVRMLDDTNISIMAAELFGLVEKAIKPKFILDFSNIQYMSSVVLGKIIEMHKRVAQSKGTLKLCGIEKKILEVFKIMKLDKVLEIHKDYKSAFNSYK